MERSEDVAKMDLSGVRDMSFSESGRIKFTADDRLRGETEVTITDPRDVKALAEFCAEFLALMQSGESPEEVGYLRIA
jgi:hypothetical protein